MVGYMVCDVSREDIDHIVERNRYREEQHLWLETLNEYPISFVGDTDEKTAQAIRACQSGQKAESKEYYDFVAARSKYGYRVHLLFSAPALEKNAREFLRNVLSMLLVLVMVWGIVLVLTWQKMTRQLTMMMQTIEQIEGGNIHVRFTNLYDDELGKLGIKVPEDISVVGFDNIEQSAFFSPPLTTINQPAYEIGRLTAKILIDQINGKTMENTAINLRPSIVERASVRTLYLRE